MLTSTRVFWFERQRWTASNIGELGMGRYIQGRVPESEMAGFAPQFVASRNLQKFRAKPTKILLYFIEKERGGALTQNSFKQSEWGTKTTNHEEKNCRKSGLNFNFYSCGYSREQKGAGRLMFFSLFICASFLVDESLTENEREIR